LEQFSDVKELFRDVVDLKNYVPLSSSEKKKVDLMTAIEQKEKMILLTGEAGSGKSLLLRRVYEELKEKGNNEVHFISNPYMETEKVLRFLKDLRKGLHHVILVDEAQLLSPEHWEMLRMYADKGNVTVVFATHDTDVKKLLELKHFKTRINYIIRLENVSFSEMQYFIYSKLLRSEESYIANMFKKSDFKKIYKFTKGSLRATNQFMYKLFDVMEFFYNKYPHKFNRKRVANKYIEIAKMDLKGN
jgi:type II secretory pathway predicted ATPase ExeA